MTCSFRNLSVIVSILVICSSKVSTNQVPCERFRLHTLGESQNSCLMDQSTSINTSRFTISSAPDDSVGGLNFVGNRKISYLPISIDKVFPNLIIINARACSIKLIMRANFINLSKLKALSLSYNQIEKIETKTFFGLTSLKYLDLSEKTFYQK